MGVPDLVHALKVREGLDTLLDQHDRAIKPEVPWKSPVSGTTFSRGRRAPSAWRSSPVMTRTAKVLLAIMLLEDLADCVPCASADLVGLDVVAVLILKMILQISPLRRVAVPDEDRHLRRWPGRQR